ncbi:MAG TPA: hypothetical protein VHE78_13350 [Gemmatimonadaceae bacterium]|nr:hypothetical protein [Gemmatimonadaceae bacterium]
MPIALALAASLALHKQGAPRDRYLVDFADTIGLQVRVQAQLGLVNGALHVEPYTRDQPGFWSSRVSMLEMRDSTGTRLRVDSASATSWSIAGGYHGAATVSYIVDLSFARRPFPSGNQKGGYAENGALYVVTKPLFVTPDTGLAPGSRLVELRVPPGWSKATPWPERTDGVYEADDRRSLTYNTFVVGRFASGHARVGGFDATAAFIGPIARDSAAIAPAFGKVVRAYFDLFPRTPPGRYLMTFFYADHDDGEGFAGSSTVTFGNRIAGGDGILFNNKIAHEVLHYWIGQRIRPDDFERMSWMSEGFTEYLANRTIFRTGLISRSEYLEKLSRHVGAYGYFWYSPLFEHRSLFEAGNDKTRNRFAVYDGGAVAALCLDLMLREATHDRGSLDDLLRLLWDRRAAQRHTFTTSELTDALVAVGGETFRDFLPKFVFGHDLLPYQEVLAHVGIRVRAWPLSAEAYLTEDPAPTSAMREARERRLFAVR